MLLTVLIIPAGWGAAMLWRWYIGNLSFSDGTRSQFLGTGGQIWGWFVLALFLNIGLAFIPVIGPVIALLAVTAIYLTIYRWVFRSIDLSSVENLEFNGGYWPYLGFSLLLALSIYTIIGWAWVSVAMARWFCRHIQVGNSQVVFTVSGLDFLWRGIVFFLGSIPIVTIPWMAVWFMRWFTGRFVLQRRA